MTGEHKLLLMWNEHIDTKGRMSLAHGAGVITKVVTIPGLNPSSATPLAPQDLEKERIIKFDTPTRFTRSNIECIAKNIKFIWGLSKLPEAFWGRTLHWGT